jgi:hypothetical protein
MNKAKTLGYSLLMLAIDVITVVTVMGWHGQECRLANHRATQPSQPPGPKRLLGEC